jgi:hypothetical protein
MGNMVRAALCRLLRAEGNTTPSLLIMMGRVRESLWDYRQHSDLTLASVCFLRLLPGACNTYELLATLG